MKKSKKISVAISYHTNEYIEMPDLAVIEIDAQTQKKIDLAKGLIKEHNLDSINIPVCANLFEDGQESEFRPDGEILMVKSYGVYYYAQNKWDGSAQIESEDTGL